MTSRRPLAAATVALFAALSLAACGSSSEPESAQSTATDTTQSAADEATTEEASPSEVTVEDNNGAQTIAVPPTSVVATDNRTFQTLSEWGVPLSAAAVSLMPDTIAYTTDDSIVDLGNHIEPDLEAVVAVEPDLIINGQRFTQYHDDFVKLAPNAVVLELDPRDGEPFDSELKRQVSVLGEIFGKQTEAHALSDDLDAAIARVKAAYNPDDTVMALVTSGGELGYVAPTVGRTLGPVFDFAGLTPALSVEGSDDHQGDDISVEAIADSNPTWILAMDRDAGVGTDDPSYSPAADLLQNSEALANVTAIKEGNIVIMPADTYTNESIQTYTTFLNDFADALEAKN